jgi:hypothetical protein
LGPGDPTQIHSAHRPQPRNPEKDRLAYLPPHLLDPVADGHKFESLEIIVDNEQGLIVVRTIALQPYPALKLFRDAMYVSLKDKLPPDVWDYATA